MVELRNVIIVLIALVAAFFLQIVFAPYIAIGNAMPNFVVAVVLASTVINRDLPLFPIAFLAGFAYAFICGGVVGLLAALLLITVFIAEVLLASFGNDSPLMAMVVLAVAAVLLNVGLAFVQCMMGLNASLFDATVLCALPCALYDTIVGIIIYFCMHSMLRETAPVMNLDSPSFR